VTPLAERGGLSAQAFHAEVVAAREPVVMRDVVGDWPAVAAARESPQALAAYLDARDSGAAVDALTIPAQGQGRIFYNRDLSGFNFTRDRMPISAVNARVMRNLRADNRPTVVAQSALIAECLPRFKAENVLRLLGPSIEPRIWLGGAAVTPAHFDESRNVACVVAGRRRFTLFPPEQVANLYIGPLGHAPTGTPISLVDFAQPDFARFPRFRQALEAARTAELGPGDAIYIPALWWHHVASLERYNALVNYWWKDAAAAERSALDGLLHTLLTVGAWPAEDRAAWAALYSHFVFGDRDVAVGHIPPERRGVLGPMTPELAEQVRVFLLKKLEG
jgi:hypothetical protein